MEMEVDPVDMFLEQAWDECQVDSDFKSEEDSNSGFKSKEDSDSGQSTSKSEDNSSDEEPDSEDSSEEESDSSDDSDSDSDEDFDFGEAEKDVVRRGKKKKLWCYRCGYSARRRNEISTHIWAFHRLKTTVQCDVLDSCRRTFERNISVIHHLADEHCVGQWDDCEACEKKFTTRKGLDMHLVNRHTKSKAKTIGLPLFVDQDILEDRSNNKPKFVNQVESGYLTPWSMKRYKYVSPKRRRLE